MIHLPVPCSLRFERRGRLERVRRNWIITSGIIPVGISIIAPEFLTLTALAELSVAWEIKREFVTRPLGRIDIAIALFRSSAPDWLSKLKAVEDTDINNYAKPNPSAKFIACGQAVWLAIQVLTRLYQHQAVTLLELSTTAYAACALTGYVAWWKKPQNATVPITIHCSTEEYPNGNIKVSLHYFEDNWMEYIWAGHRWLRQNRKEAVFLIYICPAIFGAIHLASWNNTFLSNIEQWLWRASALYCCTAGGLLFLAVLLLRICERRSWTSQATADAIGGLTPMIIDFLYIILRLFMIVEVFLSLCAPPRSAYEEVKWSTFIPHI